MKPVRPSLHLLQAFTTTAQFGGVSRAAEALHLTQSAVSKQVQELERLTGVALFERVRRRLTLTPAGQRYEALVRPLLRQLEAATFDLMTSGDGGGALRLSTLPTFGAKWLIPRLPAFQRLHPQITLQFVPYLQGYDFTRPDLDASILFGDGHWPGAAADYLAGREVTLIAPPSGAVRSAVRQPRDIGRHTLLQHVSVPNAWADWCEAHAVVGVNPLAGPQFDQFHSLIRAVAAGMGLALVPTCLVADDVAAGTVIAPLGPSDTGTLGYWLCYPESRAHFAPLASLREWLLAEVKTAATPVPATD